MQPPMLFLAISVAVMHNVAPTTPRVGRACCWSQSALGTMHVDVAGVVHRGMPIMDHDKSVVGFAEQQ